VKTILCHGIMRILSLLGKELKDDEIMELLEKYDTDVIYSFDRFHEGEPDVYWASIKEVGVQFCFNEHQLLVTIFCYIIARDGFSPVVPEIIGAPIFSSFELAEKNFQLDGIEYKKSEEPGLWIKNLGVNHDTHYEFKNGNLSMVTLMLKYLDP
jgi:hypothetical protein